MSAAPAHLRRRLVAVGVVALVLAGCVWWGVHPPRTADAYRRQSADTVELLRSDVQTARLWVQGLRDGEVTHAAVVVALTEAESGASRRSSTFASYQPPDSVPGDVRSSVTDVADRAVGVLGEVRIDARAGRWDAVTARLDDLADLAAELDRVRREVAR